jgi:TonB family protein
MAMLKGVKKLDAPPDDVPKPIWLCAQFGNKMDDLEVGWRDVNAMQYMRIVQSKIKQNWYPPKDVPPSRVVLAFKIHSDGQMSDLQLATKSGTEKIDKVALTAATQAAPFPPLPDGCFESISIQFTLDYNQHPKP